MHGASLSPSDVFYRSHGLPQDCRSTACLFWDNFHTTAPILAAGPCRRTAAGGAATPRGTREPSGAPWGAARERSCSASPPEASASAGDADAAGAEAAGASSDNVKVFLLMKLGPFKSTSVHGLLKWDQNALSAIPAHSAADASLGCPDKCVRCWPGGDPHPASQARGGSRRHAHISFCDTCSHVTFAF